MLLLKKIGLIYVALLVSAISFAQPNITRVEYFVDSDPGLGKAISVSIPANSKNAADLIINLDSTSLTPGVHVMVVRAKDANGSWSFNNRLVFARGFAYLPKEPAAVAITRMEYFIDADPGIGNGIPLAISKQTNISDLITNINVTGLSAGKHAIIYRAMDANGSWGYNYIDSFNLPALLATPAINVNSVNKSTLCARDSLIIGYQATGTFNSGNIFTVFISDANGSFATEQQIGTVTTTTNGLIECLLPSHLPDGTGYKIRVKSSNTVVTGAASTYSFTIHDRPHTQTITGAGDANATFSYPYSVPAFTGSTWKWLAPSSTISQTNNSASLLWNIARQPDTIKIIETNQYGCVGDTSIKTVNVYNLKIDNVVSPTLTPCPLGSITITGSATGVYDADNKFIAQLSDASGSFASPVNIGTVTANPVGLSQPISINATLPFPLSNGTGYRVRIIANSPAVTGSDNGQNIVINKPNLGVDKTVSKCPGFITDITSVFTTTGLTEEWSTTSPSSVDVGTYRLIVTNTNGCKDTANVTVSNYPKPNLGADKSTTISCVNGSVDLSTVYTLSGLTAVYNTPNPATAPVGSYTIVVTNTNSCKDTASIIVFDASTATVPSAGSNSKTATRECTDAAGWTHYYNDNGTPEDYSDDIRLLSIKKNGNNIGTVGDGTFQVKVAATTGAGGDHAVNVNSALVTTGTEFLSMNRYWNITPTNQPASAVGVRFYYNTQDLTDINGDYGGGGLNNAQLTIYKLQGGNPDPTSNWAGGTGVTYYTSGTNPSLTAWVYTDLGNDRQQAEFLVSSFSGGGAGAVALKALPITFTSFTATAEKDKVSLQWSTATEVNSKEFSIQRSLDGTHFETIGTAPAAGNSNMQRSYGYDDFQGISFTDQVVFFRIMETDFDGHSFYTDIKTVKILDGRNKFTLMYNPVKNEALLNYESVERSEAIIRIVDHLGRVVLVKQVQIAVGSNQIKLPAGNMAKGIYEVELISNHDRGVVRMMKE
jgi:hypothetical protein